MALRGSSVQIWEASRKMGCGSSKQADLMELAPARPGARGGNQVERTMNRQEIVENLGRVAANLDRQRHDVRIVAVGGSINTVILRSRQATHDVDFFAEGLTRQQHQVLQDSTRQIATQSRPELPPDWLNSRTTLFIDQTIRQQLQEDAIRQNAVLFSARGLTVYAAPWMYMFASKLDRIAGGGAGSSRGYDADDAYAYLEQHLSRTGQREITVDEIRTYLRRYRLDRIAQQNMAAACRQVNEAGQRHNRPASIRL